MSLIQKAIFKKHYTFKNTICQGLGGNGYQYRYHD